MQRMGRNPEKFGVLELFAAVARKNNLRIDRNDDLAKFATMALDSLTSSQAADTVLHGKRVEAMFAYIAGALAQCQMIKTEDAGELFVKGAPMLAPDYRVVLDNGTVILIEVKNCHTRDLDKKFTLTQKYAEKLQRYAELQNLPLKFAVYFSSLNSWCLLPLDAFRKTRLGFEISIAAAMAKNEMIILGDVSLATLPELRLEMMGSDDEANEIGADGNAVITFRSSKIFCRGTELTDNLDQRIAFYLMRFGRWEKSSWPIIDENKLRGIVFVSRSDDHFVDQPFAIMGAMSSMISEAYAEFTVLEGRPIALDVGLDPEEFVLSIPNDYKSKNFPLWRFLIEPNPSFKA